MKINDIILGESDKGSGEARASAAAWNTHIATHKTTKKWKARSLEYKNAYEDAGSSAATSHINAMDEVKGIAREAGNDADAKAANKKDPASKGATGSSMAGKKDSGEKNKKTGRKPKSNTASNTKLRTLGIPGLGTLKKAFKIGADTAKSPELGLFRETK